jgi:putative ABC transport system permease protein
MITLRLAWWLARGHPGRLLLLIACIAIGVAARVGVGSFLGSVDRSLADQARPLLGADVEIAGNAEFSPAQRADIRAVLPPGARTIEQWSFTTMVAVDGGGAGPVELHAVSLGHPLCGKLAAVDAAGAPLAADVLFSGTGNVLVQREFLGRFGAHVGDHVHLGKLTCTIAGIAVEDPGMGTSPFASGPRVLMPLSLLPQSGLAGAGARVRHLVMVRVRDPLQADDLAISLRKRWDLTDDTPSGFGGRAGSPSGLDVRTARQAQQSLAAVFDRLGDWLRVVALIALALGGVGVASLVRGMIGDRLDELATLAVLGAAPGRVMMIFLIQALGLGLIGGVLGAALGCAAQSLLIGLLPASIPISGAVLIDPGAVLWGISLAVVVAGSAAILPLLSMRAFSPLAVLRGEAASAAGLPLVGWVLAGAILVAAVAVAALETRSWVLGPMVVAGLVVGAVVTGVVGGLALRLLARFTGFHGRTGFALRHGFANLARPGFRPGSALVAISLAALLFGVLAVHQYSLQRELDPSRAALPSLFAIDVQDDQRDDLLKLVADAGGDRGGVVLAPIIHGRYRGRTGEAVGAGSDPAKPATREGEREKFFRDREQNISWREALGPDETIVAGRWIDDRSTEVEASLEQGWAKRLGLHLGDRIHFDVQGVQIDATITSLRTVRWMGLHPNFFILLSPHALRDAPATWVASLPPMDAATRMQVQRLISERVPNVTAFDVASAGAQINAVIARVVLAVRAIGLFCLGAGLAVVVGIALSSARGRRADAALLKVLGAGNGVIALSIFAEFSVIGAVACVLGLGESLGLAQVLLAGPLDLPLAVPWVPMVGLGIGVTALCAVVGVVACRPVFTQKPLAVLREE